MQRVLLKAVAAAVLTTFVGASVWAGADPAVKRDEFFWLSEMNKATTVINSEEKLLNPAVVQKVARGAADRH